MPYSVNPFTGEPEWREGDSGPQAVLQVGGNTGTATPDGTGLITIQTANSTPKFVNSGNASLLDFGLTNLALGSSLPSLTSGVQNASYGLRALDAVTGGGANTCIGYQAGLALTSSNGNTAIGSNALSSKTTTGGNVVAVGANAFQKLTSGDGIAIGTTCAANVLTGTNNIFIGNATGSSYTGAESSNILIGQGLGTVGESNVLRLGRQGSSLGQQSTCYIAGITGVTVAASAPVGVDSNGQMSTFGFGTANQLLVSNGAGVSPSWQTKNFAATLTGNSGGAIAPVAGNWTIVTANSTAKFVGTAGTETLDFGIDNLILGSSATAITSGTQNTGFGLGSLAAVNSGTSNACFGIGTGLNITTGSNNTFLGSGAGQFTTAGIGNTGVGASALKAFANPSNQSGNNTVIGTMAGTNLVSGGGNTLIGANAGTLYTTTESNNILIGNVGVVAENNTIRIGDLAGTQTRCFIRGISGVTVAASAPVGVDTNGQLSTYGFGTSGQVLTSGGAGVSPSWQNAASSINTITGNSGGARSPTSGNFNIVTANSTIQFVGSGSTETLDFANTNLTLGTSLPALAGGIANVSVGNTSLQALTTGVLNTVVGALTAGVLTTGNQNTIIGGAAASSLTLGSNNTAIGANALNGYTTGTGQAGSNTAIGVSALGTLGTGTFNIAIGASAGNSLNLANSSNICIGNTGVAGDNNTIRIGTQGTGSGQQSVTYLAGQLNTLSGRVRKVTTHASASAYTLLISDEVLAVTTTSAVGQVNLPAAPTTGQSFRIKDAVGNATTNNITVSGNGKNIDGTATKVINTNYGSYDLCYNGTQWNIL